ncbi:Keratin, type I cytoskeletal 18 [Saguinus oedipus]|uniref:Keratin, type I cytoskeletal 18 n=1 Tax=Saguinus oedipus TaxID=9490 RepID=A0ABQ9WEG2_SAGOE|nr:Keratin, type I cytoskeletal 18 [Saguinus oedipus]
MSFTTCSIAPTTGSWVLSRHPAKVLASQQHGQCLCRCWGLWFPDLQVQLHQLRGGLGSRDVATGLAGGLAGMGGIQNEKETVQSLKDGLDSYQDRVKNLETENQRLERKIREHLEKERPQVRDWGHYLKTIQEFEG